jgi:hypothetical protein
MVKKALLRPASMMPGKAFSRIFSGVNFGCYFRLHVILSFPPILAVPSLATDFTLTISRQRVCSSSAGVCAGACARKLPRKMRAPERPCCTAICWTSWRRLDECPPTRGTTGTLGRTHLCAERIRVPLRRTCWRSCSITPRTSCCCSKVPWHGSHAS